MKKILSIVVMAFAALQPQAQSTAKGGTVIRGGYGIWSADIGYLVSANAKNSKESKPLWAGNGYAASLNYRWGDRFGIAGKAGYSGGKTNEKNAQAFASSLVTSPFTAKVSGLKTNWSQVNVAAGPSLLFGKNHEGEINAVGGIGFGSGNKVSIDKYDAQTKVGTIFTATEKKIKPYWEVETKYQVAKIGKGGICVRASYGTYGAAAGLAYRWGDRWGI